MVLKTSVIYLLKDKFQFYNVYDGRVYEFRFVPEVVRDLDLINGGMFEELIKVFITNCKLAPASLVIVLAENAYFAKEFHSPPHEKVSPDQNIVSKELLQKEADEFIEHVPFDNVVSKTLPYGDGLKTYATNKDLYEAIAIAFEHNGFTIDSVVPVVVFGNGLQLHPALDSIMAMAILQKINTVKQYNFMGQQVFQPQIQQETGEVDEIELEHLQVKKPNNKRLYGLVGVLFSLFIVLIIVYMQSQTPPPPRQPALASTGSVASPAANPVAPTSAITIAPTAAPTSPNLSETQNLSLQLVNASNSTTVVQSLQGDFGSFKFKNMSTQTQSSIGSSGSLISFGPNVEQDVKDAVIAEVKKYETNVAVQEQEVNNYDITIVLGQ